MVFYFLIALIPFFFTKKILIAIGTEQEVSELSAIMVRLLLPTEFVYGQYDLRKRWLACQRITFVPMVASIISTLMHVPLCYLFVHTAGFGLHGLAFANFIKESITLMITMTYCRCRPEIREVLQPFSMDALSGWGQYLKVSLPATAMICAELWAIHAMTFMAGALGVLEVASLTICISILAILFSVAMGI